MPHMENTKPYQNLPTVSGVYLFKDEAGQVLYIGKAINLKNRVKSYFTKGKQEAKTKILVGQVRKIDYHKVGSELEALLLEARLIKQYRPKYNIRLKDDKRYLYVGITKDEYPRVIFLRRPESEIQLLDWFGPFPSAASLRETLRLIRRIFPYCSCQERKTPCLYYHLGVCPGVGIQPKKEYHKTIDKIRLFLNGQIGFLVNLLTKQMKQAAANLKFEEAQQAKRQIKMIQNLLGRYKKLPDEERQVRSLAQLRELVVRYQKLDPLIIHRLEAYDVSNLGEKIIVGSMVVFIEGEPDHGLYRQFRIREKKQDDTAGIKNILQRRLEHREWLYPQLILVDGGRGQISVAFEALKAKGLSGEVGLLGLVKEKEVIIIPRIHQNEIAGWRCLSYSPTSLVLQLLQQARDEAHRFAQRYYKKLHRKTIFV